MMIKIFLLFIYLFKFVDLFQIIPVINIKGNKNINMNYYTFKDYDESLTILPNFQSNILINNWICFLREKDDNEVMEHLKKAIFDMKFFISINKDKDNIFLFAWCPEETVKILVGTRLENNTIYVERIAKNPYSSEFCDEGSYKLKKELCKYVKNSIVFQNINFKRLYEYDERYKLSWNYLDLI